MKDHDVITKFCGVPKPDKKLQEANGNGSSID